MATNYDALRLLQAFGWRQRIRIGDLCYLEHREMPGVQIVRSGKLSAPLSDETLLRILEEAGSLRG